MQYVSTASYRQGRFFRRVWGHIYRFGLLTLAMAMGIGLLVVIEGVVLWRLGVDYSPRMAIQSVGVWDFSVDDSGRWAASRIIYTRRAGQQSLQCEVVLHDMRWPDQPVCLDVAGQPRRLAISALSDRLAIGCDDGSIYVGSSTGAAPPPRQIVQLPQGEPHQLAWSADGQTLAATDRHHLYLWRFAEGQLGQDNLLQRRSLQGIAVTLLEFSSDGGKLLTVSPTGVLRLWDVASGRIEQTLGIGEKVHQARWSCDDRAILMVTTGSGVQRRILDISTGSESSQALQVSRQPSGPLAISRDGSVIAAVYYMPTGRYYIQRWNAQTGEPLGTSAGGIGYVNGLAFAADDTLYSWDSQGQVARLDFQGFRGPWRFDALQWARSEPALQASASEPY